MRQAAVSFQLSAVSGPLPAPVVGSGSSMSKRTDEKPGATTRRYYVPAEEDTTTAPLRPGPPTAHGIEVEYRLAGPGPRDKTMLKIWTKNRIYRVDATMTCVEVFDRRTGKPDSDARLVGSLLSGGQARRPDDDIVDLYYPFPVPGSSAFFTDRATMRVLGRTSAIERVVLRLHKMRVRQGELDQRWDSVTGRFRAR
jgi:hypothetical protein